MGFFKYLDRLSIEGELKEQKDLFYSQPAVEKEIKQSCQKPLNLQEIEAEFHEREMQFRQWFIECYIIPKYFTKSIPPWV